MGDLSKPRGTYQVITMSLNTSYAGKEVLNLYGRSVCSTG
jgi:hypothetical protein